MSSRYLVSVHWAWTLYTPSWKCIAFLRWVTVFLSLTELLFHNSTYNTAAQCQIWWNFHSKNVNEASAVQVSTKVAFSKFEMKPNVQLLKTFAFGWKPLPYPKVEKFLNCYFIRSLSLWWPKEKFALQDFSNNSTNGKIPLLLYLHNGVRNGGFILLLRNILRR